MRTGQIPNFESSKNNPPLNRQNSLRVNASEVLEPQIIAFRKSSSPRSIKDPNQSRTSINDNKESLLSFEDAEKTGDD